MTEWLYGYMVGSAIGIAVGLFIGWVFWQGKPENEDSNHPFKAYEDLDNIPLFDIAFTRTAREDSKGTTR